MENKEKFLSLNLGTRDTAVISLHQITEVFQVSLADICGVPQMPSCVLGIYNWRGEMLWLVDLEEMLGYPPVLQGANFLSNLMAIVLEREGKYLGLLVRSLMDIESLDTNQIKPASAELFYPAMSPFLKGYFINSAEEMILNLDATAIIQSPLWAINN
ncbi:chemotaxis protein CheW [Nodularia spumigena]|uniref:Chemotaxis protein CheW n=1 Tax=Nodularia spumigena CENA596 TaxID=1819295 RepID=A0A161VW93_NODSP|nr:chemotaxis protein CheW [Nodularia spumigena]MDB9358366.1 chemotaxis protein CheW [Nodularia spumigena CS-587/03]MDB9402043.1 chemotaxis protein CheW [Microcystis aeruginosa CS-567/02-A1]KZL51695.1 chemotaxis protein CheW [Nodularia spumigena CENA596]MDB9305383.1 chemotaxis protein CheW [Nodularia spumigena CS-591/12]MDB9318855.1 chemotaxis protein CheW [Nodularia spumigena CS-590/01A]